MFFCKNRHSAVGDRFDVLSPSLAMLGVLLIALFTASVQAQQPSGVCDLRREQLSSKDLPSDTIRPSCNKNGWYEAEQCDHVTATCWCVDGVDGTEVKGTRNKRPDVKCHKCLIDRAAALPPPDSAAGGYLPQCDENGKYEPVQHSVWTGQFYTGPTFCVNVETGAEVPGTRQSQSMQTRTDCGANATSDSTATTTKGPVTPFSKPPPCTPPPADSPAPPPGTFVPQCAPDGRFEQRQCSGSTGYCWCANPETGEKIPNTEKRPGQGEVKCDGSPATPPGPSGGVCDNERNYQLSNNPPPGTFIPTCNKNGWYEPKQCDSSTGYCWCVDPQRNREVQGTRVRGQNVQCGKCLNDRSAALPPPESAAGMYVPQCDEAGKYDARQRQRWNVQYYTGDVFCVNPETGAEIPGTRKPQSQMQEGDCYQNTTQAPTTMPRPCTPPPPGSPEPPPGTFVPKCTPDGFYEPLQCSLSTGHCWCVAPTTGQKIPITDAGPGQGKPDCSGIGPPPTRSTKAPQPSDVPPCKAQSERQHDPVSPPAPGSFTPSCTPNGWYNSTQCHGSTGQCWCVSPITGKEISGTRVSPGAGKSANCPRCLVHQAQQLPPRADSVGGYIPQCGEDGKYTPLQKHPSTGYSWCVDPDTGAELSGTRVAPGQGNPNPCGTGGSNGKGSTRTGAPPPGPGPGPSPSPSPPPFVRDNPCDSEYKSLHPANGVPPGTFVPTCTANGWYETQQCSGSTGYCWCVFPDTGKELSGSRVPPGSGRRPACPKCLTHQAKELPPAGALGGYAPQCDASGKYNPLQASPNGYSWCVNPDTGAEVPGTRQPPGKQKGNACGPSGAATRSGAAVRTGAPPPPPLPPASPNDAPCEAERKRQVAANMPSPSCTENGWYTAGQCNTTTGVCWCVFPQTGEEISGSETEPGSELPTCPKCVSEQATALPPKMAVGAYVPQCDKNGKYEPFQGSPNGQSWCVDPETGAEVPGTRQPAGKQTANPCGTPGNGTGSASTTTGTPPPLPPPPPPSDEASPSPDEASPSPDDAPCEVEAKRLNAQNAPPGTFIPTCTENGWYNATQCSGSTGECWCVFPDDGKELSGTKVPPGRGKPPTCPKCLEHQAQELPPKRAVGAYVPQCDKNGKYNPLQAHGSTGYSWCVDPETGTEVPGTRQPPGKQTQNPCGPAGSETSASTRTGALPPPPPPQPQVAPARQDGPCEAEAKRLNAENAPPGTYIPTCTEKGWYNITQCSGSTGECWCVFPMDGTVLNGTKTAPGRGPPTCPKCLVEQAPALPARDGGSTGYIPQCDGNGKYEPLQGAGSSGYTFCVDPETGEEVPGTRKPPGQQQPGACGSAAGGAGGGKTSSSAGAGAGYAEPAEEPVAGNVHRNVFLAVVAPPPLQTAPGPGTAPAPLPAPPPRPLEVGPNPTCATAKRSLPSPPAPGQHVPTCSPKGWYNATQCNSSGRCWCVYPESGQPIYTNESTPVGQRPVCPKCLIDQAAHLESPEQYGYYYPQCNETGHYEPTQANQSLGHQWCVRPDGTEVPKTRSNPGARRTITCTENGTPVPAGPCELARQQVGDIPRPPGWYPLTCSDNGLFSASQYIHGSCWCVDPRNGRELNGTRDACNSGIAPCKACHMHVSKLPRPAPGTYIPQCDETGDYLPIQLDASTGHKWCVNPQTGQEVPNSRTGPGQRRNVTCAGGQEAEGPCQRASNGGYKQCSKGGWYYYIQCNPAEETCYCVDENGEEVDGTKKYRGKGQDEGEPQCGKCHIQASTRLPPIPGNTPPQCDSKGNYLPFQWDASTGYRWCADPSTGSKIPGTETPPSQQSKNLTCGGGGKPTESVCKPNPLDQMTECTATGWHKPIQCQSNLCSCVNPHSGMRVQGEGQQIPAVTAGLPQCGKCFLAYSDAPASSPGQYLPQCDRKGNYKPEQVDPSTGYRWCVSADGKVVPGTKIPPGQARAAACAAAF